MKTEQIFSNESKNPIKYYYTIQPFRMMMCCIPQFLLRNRQKQNKFKMNYLIMKCNWCFISIEKQKMQQFIYVSVQEFYFRCKHF